MKENKEDVPKTEQEPTQNIRNVCPFCNSVVYWYSKRKELWKCYVCKKEFEEPNKRPAYKTGYKRRNPKNMVVLTRQQLLFILDNITSSSYLRNRALISFIYLTGARVSEVVGLFRKYQWEEIKTGGFNNALITNLPVLKRREKIYRNVPVDLEAEAPFIKFIEDYFATIGDGSIAFDIGRKTAWSIIFKNTGMFIHYFRHLRVTHLVTHNNFSSADLVQFMGWADSRPANIYAHLSWQDLALKMKRNKIKN